MPVYANVTNGRVAELFTPPHGLTIEQCFHPGMTWVDITGRIPQPQVGWNATMSGGIWTMAAPIIAPPTLAQQAQQILGTAVQVISTSQPSLNGTYPIDNESRVDVMAEMISLGANGTFTNGLTTLNVLDTSLNPHAFNIPQFQSYATAVGNFVTSLKMTVSGKLNVLPQQPIIIS
jgi:hypothetical protein